jgi:hypothetical protein
LKQQRKQQKDSLKYTTTELKAAEEDLANVQLLCSNVDSPVRQSVDQRILKENGIDRVATHGGQFTGTHCLLIEKRVDPIIDELEKVLLANPEKVESDSATKEALQKFRLHFLLMGKVFSLLRTSKVEATRRRGTRRVYCGSEKSDHINATKLQGSGDVNGDSEASHPESCIGAGSKVSRNC